MTFINNYCYLAKHDSFNVTVFLFAISLLLPSSSPFSLSLLLTSHSPSLFLILFSISARAQHFHSLNGPDLADWMNSVGLEMYGELISQLVGTGERLASICSNTEDLMVDRIH